jgi:IclR family transcriptional regulator, acetate operon repressor
MALCRLLLEVDNETGLSVTYAARALDVDKSTVSRLLGTLAAAGMVLADEETHRYRVGPFAFQLGNRFEGAALARTLQPALRRLAKNTNATAQIGTLRGDHVLYLLVAQSGMRLRVVASPGDTRYIHASAMGKAMLAGMPEAESKALIAGLATSPDAALPESGPNTIIDPELLQVDLARIRKRGYAISDQEAESGVSAIGVNIPGIRNFPLAVSVAFPAAQFRRADERAHIVSELHSAADSIAQMFQPGV